MNLVIDSSSLREIAGEHSLFPAAIRDALCEAVRSITVEEMEALLSKHEADVDNFDGRVEANLRRIDGSLKIASDERISIDRKFNHDLVISADDALVCVEIEKGYMARFEFDILKMLAFCSNRIAADNAPKHIYGAFIVPNDNIVARHIAGNARESSYKYLMRICGLIAQIQPFPLEDILFIGYGIEEPKSKPVRKRRKAVGKQPSEVVHGEGLLSDNQLAGLADYPPEAWKYIRAQLAAKLPSLREKFNPNSRYLGYATGRADGAYVYVQRKRLRIDLGIAADRADEIIAAGFEVNHIDNFQAKKGWLTGLYVPHDSKRLDEIVDLLGEALEV